MMVRIDQITTRDGKNGGRLVISKTRGGLLIDCFGEGESLEKAGEKIGLFCANYCGSHSGAIVTLMPSVFSLAGI